MQTQGGRRLIDAAQGSPRRRPVALHAYGHADGFGDGRQLHPESSNRMSNQRLPQRNTAQKLIYDQQRNFAGNPASQSAVGGPNPIGTWKSRNDEKLKQSILQDHRASYKSTSVAAAGFTTSQASTRDKQSSNVRNAGGRYDKGNHRQQSVRNHEHLTTRSGALLSQNDTLPIISQRQQPKLQSSGKMSNGAAGPEAALQSTESRSNMFDNSLMQQPSAVHGG